MSNATAIRETPPPTIHNITAAVRGRHIAVAGDSRNPPLCAAGESTVRQVVLFPEIFAHFGC